MSGTFSQADGSAMLPSVKPQPCTPDELLAAFLAGRAATTMDAYRRDLADFARFVKAESIV